MLRASTMIPNKERLTLCLISITISCLRSCWELLQWFQIKRTGILFDVNLSSWSSGFFFLLLFSAIDPCSSLPRPFPIIVNSLCRLLRWSKRRGWSFHSTQDLSLNSPYCLPYLSLSHVLRIWFYIKQYPLNDAKVFYSQRFCIIIHWYGRNYLLLTRGSGKNNVVISDGWTEPANFLGKWIFQNKHQGYDLKRCMFTK